MLCSKAEACVRQQHLGSVVQGRGLSGSSRSFLHQGAAAALCVHCAVVHPLCVHCAPSLCAPALLKLELSSAAEPFHSQYLSSCLDVTLSRKRPSWIQMFAIPSIKPSCKLESRQARPLGSFSAGRCGFLLFALNQGSQQIDIDSLTT